MTNDRIAPRISRATLCEALSRCLDTLDVIAAAVDPEADTIPVHEASTDIGRQFDRLMDTRARLVQMAALAARTSDAVAILLDEGD